jgi:hypothetical protein
MSSTVAGELAARLEARKLEAERAFASLALEVAKGAKVDVDQAAAIVDAADKAPCDLAAAVEMKKARLAWAAQRDNAPALEAERRMVGEQVAAARRAGVPPAVPEPLAALLALPEPAGVDLAGLPIAGAVRTILADPGRLAAELATDDALVDVVGGEDAWGGIGPVLPETGPLQTP